MTVILDSAAVAEYLADHPGFFEEHAGLLSEVKLASPLTGKTVSLQERQMEVMRAKFSALELRMAELLKVAADNTVIINRFHAWQLSLLQSSGGAAIARDLVDGLITHFGVPQASLRLWQVGEAHAGSWFGADVSADVRLFTNSLRAPYCGPNKDFEAVRWLSDAASVRSTALVPLVADGQSFGLLVLGSPDSERFSAQMATDFLAQLGLSASAALAPLRG